MSEEEERFGGYGGNPNPGSLPKSNLDGRLNRFLGSGQLASLVTFPYNSRLARSTAVSSGGFAPTFSFGRVLFVRMT